MCAQEVIVQLICDFCKVWDGGRTTQGVTTIGIPRTMVELDGCPVHREAVQPILDVIFKQGRLPSTDRSTKARRVGTKPADRPALTAAAPPQAGQIAFVEPVADQPAVQDWRIVSAPDDLQCTFGECDFEANGPRHYAIHLKSAHPEEVPVCIVCGERTVLPFKHYMQRHPDMPRPAGSYKGHAIT